MSVILGLFLATAIFDSGGTQTDSGYCIELADQSGAATPSLVGKNGVVLGYFGNDGAILDNYVAFESDSYEVLDHESYDLYLYAGYFDPNGQFL